MANHMLIFLLYRLLIIILLLNIFDCFTGVAQQELSVLHIPILRFHIDFFFSHGFRIYVLYYDIEYNKMNK